MAYPTSLDSFTHKVNDFDTFMAEDVNELQDAIEAIEAELGTTPKGSSADVAARFAALDTLLGSNPQSIYADLAARLTGYDSGWINLPTCTYVSATSFTLTGDWTTKLKLGVYWGGYNGSQKYGYVLSSTYSAGTGLTTVNLVANTSYSLANAAITGSKFAYSPPPDFKNWMSYAAVLYVDSGTFTSASATGKFKVHGKTCEVALSASVVTNGTAVGLKISVPFTSAGVFIFNGRENQITGVTLQGILSNGSDRISIYNYAGSNINANGVTVYMNGFFEIA
jgi:hypothetical protein